MNLRFTRWLLCFCLLTIFCLSTFGQKAEFFSNINFDSSYTILGIGRGFGKYADSLERFWFLLTDPAEMQKLQKDWDFSTPARPGNYNQISLDIYVIREKRLAARSGLIYPLERMITPGNGRWYTFDTSKLIALHAAHPLHYHTEQKLFQTFVQYADYGNSILHDPKLLFFFEPSLKYQGKFVIAARRTNDNDSPIFVAHDIQKELEILAPANSFQVGTTINDSFNSRRKDSVRVTVECAKSLYDQYVPVGRIKGPWEPATIEITTFWRDDL